MSEVLKKFGRYFLLDQIAQGGMAEIYRARLASPDGAGRLLVIKRIQAGFGSNNEFLQMFKSEIKVTMGFNHSNIVQLYDFGEELNQPFIAMEYVDGKNLRQFLNRFKEMKQAFPAEFAAHIIEQAAAGLYYAHTFKDKISGEPLNIVHRDISPQNIIISFEGNVKIIDFGIAKAKTNSEHTRAGVIKGKPSYLSPEQISGDTVDGRADLFALGAVFWELLTGTKLFQGENDLAVLKMIESCSTTVRFPSEINPNVPRELDQIVMKMLAKQPEKRYQNGEELARALRKFIISYSPDFGPTDLSHVVKELFNKEIVEDRKRIQRLNERVEQLLLNDVPPLTKTDTGTQANREETTTFVATKPMAPARELSMAQEVLNQQFTVETTRPTRSRALTQTGGSLTGSGPGTRVSGHYPRAASSGGSSWMGWIGAAAALGAAVIYAPKLGVQIPYVSKYLGGEAPPVAVNPPVETPEQDPGTQQNEFGDKPKAVVKARLKLNVFPEGLPKRISLNGQIIDPANPVAEVDTGAPLELAVEREGFETFRSEFVIDARVLSANGEYQKEVILEPDMTVRSPAQIAAAENGGYLTILSTPPTEATIYLNGKLFVRRKVPVERMAVPAGDYEIRFYSVTLDREDRQKFTVQKGRTVTRTVDLKEPRR